VHAVIIFIAHISSITVKYCVLNIGTSIGQLDDLQLPVKDKEICHYSVKD